MPSPRTSRPLPPLLLAPLLAATLLVGCTSPTAPLPELAPRLMEFTVAGYEVGSWNWQVRGDTVVYARASWTAATVDSLKVVPTAEAWRVFWAAVDTAGVRQWRGRYHAPLIVDGVGWQLVLRDTRLLVVAGGSNAFPDRLGRKHEGEATLEYLRFTRALYELVGIAVALREGPDAAVAGLQPQH